MRGGPCHRPTPVPASLRPQDRLLPQLPPLAPHTDAPLNGANFPPSALQNSVYQLFDSFQVCKPLTAHWLPDGF